MAIVEWPDGLKAPFDYTPGNLYAIVRPEGQLGAMTDRMLRFKLRVLTFQWQAMEHDDFTRVDGLVELIEATGGMVNVPWRPYQHQLGGGTGDPTVNGDHAAGDVTLATTGWTGIDPVLAQFDMIALEQSNVWRLHRVLASVNAPAPTLTIDPPLRDAIADTTPVRYLGATGTGDGFLRLTMELADPSQVQGQVITSPKPQIGQGFVMSFVEAIRPAY